MDRMRYWYMMDEWMDEWMNGWMDRCIDGWKDKHVHIDGYIYRLMDGSTSYIKK